MAPRKQPRRWVDFALEQYPSSLGTDVYRWSTRPLAGSIFVEGRVPIHGWEIIRRALSSMSGDPHIDHASVLLLDNDGLIRELLDGESTQWFLNRLGDFKLLSEAGWNANLTPRLLFSGQCYDVQPVDSRRARIEFEDVLAKYLDRLYPQYTVADAYPNAADDVRAIPLPLVWGPHTDAGATLNGRPAAKGQLPAFYVQDTDLSEFTGVTPGSPDGPAWTRNFIDPGWFEDFGDLQVRYASHTGAFPATMGIIAYLMPIHPTTGELYNYAFPLNRQAPVNALDPNTNYSPILSPTDTWSPRYVWNKFDFLGVTEFLLIIAGNDVGDADPNFEPFFWPTRCTWARYKVLGPSDYEEAAPPVGGSANWEYTVDAGRDSWGDDFLSNTSVVHGGGDLWGELLVSEYVQPITRVHGSDLGMTAQRQLEMGSPSESELQRPRTTAIRIPLPLDRFGSDIRAPLRMDDGSIHPSWPFSVPYVERNGHRLTVIFVRGALLDHHRNGVVTIAVDGCGVQDDLAQDGSGDPIDQAAFVFQDFLSEVVFANDGAGTKGGPKAGIPLFADGRPMFWTSKIQDGQALTAARLNTEKGYLCSMALHEPITLREWLRRFHVTFGSFSGRNHHGQIFPLWIPDSSYDVASGKAVRERIELGSLPAPTLDHRAIENEIEAVYGRDPEQQTWRTAPRIYRDQASIDALKGQVRRGRRELWYTTDEATAVDVISRTLLLLSHAPRFQPLPLRTDGVDLELGDVVRVSHRDGLGPRGVGYLERPFLILAHEHVGDHITVTGLDIQRMVDVYGENVLPATLTFTLT